jgi:DNA repair exonuclease SbcCD ATPase subunit
MQLTTSQRREVIEELLDLKVFTRMNGVLKEKYSILREDIKTADSLLASSKEKYELQNSHIEKLKVKNNQDREEKENQIRDIQDKIEELTGKNTEFLDLLQQKKQEMDDYISGNNPSELISHYDNLKSSIGKESKDYSKKKEFYETNDCCPTCKQSIDIKFKNTALESLEGKIQESDRAIVALTNRISKQKERQKIVNGYISSIQDINAELAAINIKISEANGYISKLRSSLGLNMDEMIRNEEAKAIQIKNDMSKYEKDKETLMEKRFDYDTIQLLLKDSGIKSKIIKQYLPLMNKYINKYLASMDFFVNFNLDDGFKERIKSRHRDDFEYNSFSEGEKFRIDMALMLTWREIARAKNSTNTNLLILDEVFDGSLDSSGTEEFLKLLRQLSTNTHIFVISHKGDILTDKFDRSIRVDKKNNFSRMV